MTFFGSCRLLVFVRFGLHLCAPACTCVHVCGLFVCVCVCGWVCMCMPTGEENVVFCMGFGSSWLFVLLSIRGDCGFSYGLGFGFVFRVWQWEW